MWTGFVYWDVCRNARNPTRKRVPCAKLQQISRCPHRPSPPASRHASACNRGAAQLNHSRRPDAPQIHNRQPPCKAGTSPHPLSNNSLHWISHPTLRPPLPKLLPESRAKLQAKGLQRLLSKPPHPHPSLVPQSLSPPELSIFLAAHCVQLAIQAIERSQLFRSQVLVKYPHFPRLIPSIKFKREFVQVLSISMPQDILGLKRSVGRKYT